MSRSRQLAAAAFFLAVASTVFGAHCKVNHRANSANVIGAASVNLFQSQACSDRVVAFQPATHTRLSRPNQRCKLNGFNAVPWSMVHDVVDENTRDSPGKVRSMHRRWTIGTILASGLLSTRSEAWALSLPFGIGSDSDRQELNLCVVTLLRTQYWAQAVGYEMQAALRDQQQDEEEIPASGEQSATDKEEKRRKTQKLYLEARLGAKALLTKKVGGGATAMVYTLGAMKLRESLEDATWWYWQRAGRRNVGDANRLDAALRDILESLASSVEFDGLETTQDPSPRSSLTLSMFTTAKAVFVKRTLLEQTIPAIDTFLNTVLTTNDRDLRRNCESFIRLNYPDEYQRVEAAKALVAATTTNENATWNVTATAAASLSDAKQPE